MACCNGNCEVAGKIKGDKTATQVYDEAHGKYKPMAPQVTAGAPKGGPSFMKGAK